MSAPQQGPGKAMVSLLERKSSLAKTEGRSASAKMVHRSNRSTSKCATTDSRGKCDRLLARYAGKAWKDQKDGKGLLVVVTRPVHTFSATGVILVGNVYSSPNVGRAGIDVMDSKYRPSNAHKDCVRHDLNKRKQSCVQTSCE